MAWARIPANVTGPGSSDIAVRMRRGKLSRWAAAGAAEAGARIPVDADGGGSVAGGAGQGPGGVFKAAGVRLRWWDGLIGVSSS